jgi:hypothetical protein
MEEVVAFLGYAAGMIAIMAGLRWLGIRARRRGIGGEAIGVFNEIYRPSAHQHRFEVVEQRTAPTPDK